MLLWLSGNENEKGSPNENYARELMELFTLGAKRGYTERDVREQARALTGFRNDWTDGVGRTTSATTRAATTTGTKRIFGKTRALRLEGRRAASASTTARTRPSSCTSSGATSSRRRRRPPRAARSSGSTCASQYAVRPVVEAILKHPRLFEGPRMTKPPMVYLAGMLRTTERGVDTEAWTWLRDQAGQQLFRPPNVAGWDDDRWLDTATFLARWNLAGRVLRPVALRTSSPAPFDADALVKRALAFWGTPPLTAATRRALTPAFAAARSPTPTRTGRSRSTRR